MFNQIYHFHKILLLNLMDHSLAVTMVHFKIVTTVHFKVVTMELMDHSLMDHFLMDQE